MTCQAQTANADQTEDLAAMIGARLRGGEVIELSSDLGGGKTTFVRGLARGFGSHDRVASPSFTLSKVYKSGNKEMHHFDFYRLHDAGIMTHELAELLHDKSIVLVVEWAELVHDVLPANRLTIKFEQAGDDGRRLSFEAPDSMSYLLEGVC
jgi:tRNA threonylcarbamoyladenosine biosynthesis protein TsaE